MDPLLVFFGFGVGVLVGTTGMGGGSLMTPLLILLWTAALAHLVSGNIDLALAGTLLLGSIPGVWVGTGLATPLPERGLRPALGIVMITSGLALLTKAGVNISAVALLVIPLALCLGSYAILRRSATTPAASPAARAPGPPAPQTPPR